MTSPSTEELDLQPTLLVSEQHQAGSDNRRNDGRHDPVGPGSEDQADDHGGNDANDDRLGDAERLLAGKNEAAEAADDCSSDDGGDEVGEHWMGPV
jgi:hypothetical protein